MFKTMLLNVGEGASRESVEEGYRIAAELLQRGEVVGIPTETVYGLAGDALNAVACRKIFEAKGRPRDNPLIVHIANRGMLCRIVDETRIDARSLRLMDAFWPGPLTLLLPKLPCVPDEVTCGLDTVAVRMPAHPVASRLMTLCDRPLAAPSANLSGFPSPTTAAHVFHDLSGRIPAIVDGGPCEIGLESSVVNAAASPPLLLRPGGLTLEKLATLLPDIIALTPSMLAVDAPPPTPGLKYRHYAPNAKLMLMESVQAHDFVSAWKADQPLLGWVRWSSSQIPAAANVIVREWIAGSSASLLSDEQISLAVASKVFAFLRELDELGVSIIVVEPIKPTHYGLAVMNRLLKATTLH